MTMVQPPIPRTPDASPAPLPPKQLRETLIHWGARLEGILDFLGDRLNPILVKEARQAMKSKQFSVTFSLLLLLSWVWTALFISFAVPGVFYAPWGMYLLFGYVFVLSVPLFIVVPFAAFRSLAAETEDGTFELLSITALSARQIVAGKLSSAILQMMVYYSALAPSIAFTYLLKGVDIVSLGLLLLHSFAISVMLSIIGLVAATVTRSRHWQVLVSVVLIAGLLFAAFLLDSAFVNIVGETRGNLPYDEPGFWVANLALLTFWVAFGTLFLFIAAGQITFASENRSTRIRYVLLVIQALWIGWMMFMWRWVNESYCEPSLWIMVYFAAGFWMIAGSLLSGETAQLSPRAKRDLPQSLLGRILLTWLNPGSGSGYTFAVVNLGVVVLVQFYVFTYALIRNERVPSDMSWFFASIALWGYVASYMGFVRLLASLGRRFAPINMFAVFLIQVVFCLMGMVLPLILLSIQSAGDPSLWQYSELQLPNWAWTMYQLTWPGTRATTSWAIPVSLFALGLFIFLVNLFDTAQEVEQVRTLAPQRVRDDDLAQRPLPARRKKNPWDEP